MVVFLWLGYVQDNIQYREPPFQPRVGKDILPIYSSAGRAGRQAERQLNDRDSPLDVVDAQKIPRRIQT